MHGVRLDLRPSASDVHGNAGEFLHAKKQMRVHVADADWLLTLAHEYAHLRQWIDRPKWYLECEDDTEDFPKFLASAPSARRALRVTRVLQRIELDAERRTLALARQFRLASQAEIQSYPAGANLYVWQHEIARRLRRWPEYTDAETQSIVDSMPSRLMTVRQISNPPAVMEIFAK